MSTRDHHEDRGLPVPVALQQALIDADAKHRASLRALRRAICDYVDDLRGRGMPVIDITRVVRERVVNLRASGRMAAPAPPDDLLLDQIVEWCMEAGSNTP